MQLLSPIGIALAATGRPRTLGLGLIAGALTGGLTGLAVALAFIRSPAAFVVIPISILIIVVIWPLALASISVLVNQADKPSELSTGSAIASVIPRIPSLTLVALPLALGLGALLAIQIFIFALTRAPEGVMSSSRPLAVVATLFMLLFVIDALSIATSTILLWTLVPQVAVNQLSTAAAYQRARSQFWDQPGWTIASMASVFALAVTVSGAALGPLFIALGTVSVTQILGANELVLLHLTEPLLQASFAIPLDNFVAIVVLVTGIGTTIGAAVGVGHTFGVSGGTGLLQAATSPEH